MKKINGELKTGAVLVLIIIVMTLVSLFWTPFDPYQMDSARRFLPPGAEHILGTDNFGRDVFSRIMSGGAYTLLLAVCTVAASAIAGTALGLTAGFAGGILDQIVMRAMDALSSFPGLLLALVTTAVAGNNPFGLFFALHILFIPGFTRVTRSAALQFKKADFILAEKILGASSTRIIFTHILPNAAPSLLSAGVIGFSNAILAEAAMSYLGLGIQPPVPSWGRMLSESQNYLYNAPWCALAPGFCILLSVLAFHCVGEGLRKGAVSENSSPRRVEN
ncbi:MAG TPA: peptide ABC transporter permease [Treponema sp.]|nr:peptide ABC transporter permease [Treponema sp.]